LAPTAARELSQGLDEMVKRRVSFLTAYQDAAYAARYRDLVERTKATEAAKVPGSTALTEAVARYYFKLMAVKDEYEVARLYTDGSFERQLRSQFEGDLRLEFHLAPPLFARRDEATGLPLKSRFGPWMMTAMRALARLRRLRGTVFDPFGRTAERRMERRLIADYERCVAEILPALTPGNHALAVALASIPEKIRGFGHVKERHLAIARAEEIQLLERFRGGGEPRALAAE
jgi:indolepyruvate ferredoxin oxidoreductase